MMKPVVYAAILGQFMFQSVANARTLELSHYMSDRYERNCAVRLQPDLYNGHISSLMAANVLKDRQLEEGTGTFVSLNLDKTEYRNVPVVKVEYLINPAKRQYSQALYFDLTSATAKQNFSKIHFQRQSNLNQFKEGRFTVLRCNW